MNESFFILPKSFPGSTNFTQLLEGAAVYGVLISASPQEIEAEYLRWKHSWAGIKDPPATALDSLSKCDKNYYPLTAKLLHIFSTLPVTSASVERSFSAMKGSVLPTEFEDSGQIFGIGSNQYPQKYPNSARRNYAKFCQENRRLDFGFDT